MVPRCISTQHTEHAQLTSQIIHDYWKRNFQGIGEKIVRAARLRGFLG